MVKLDELDFKILQLLRQNSQEPLLSLSKKLNNPKSTIHARIKKLQKSGIIKRFGIYLEMKKLDLSIVGFVMLKFDPTRSSITQVDAAKQLSEFSKVQEVHIIAGEWDIICKVRAKDIDELGSFVITEMKKINGISSSFTYVVLQQIKECNDPPFEIDGF